MASEPMSDDLPTLDDMQTLARAAIARGYRLRRRRRILRSAPFVAMVAVVTIAVSVASRDAFEQNVDVRPADPATNTTAEGDGIVDSDTTTTTTTSGGARAAGPSVTVGPPLRSAPAAADGDGPRVGPTVSTVAEDDGRPRLVPPPSSHLAWATTTGGFFVGRADGTAKRAVALPAHDGVSSFAASPDGRRIAVVITRSSLREIWIVDGDGSNPRRLPAAADPQSPTWSPDGRRIAYQSGVASLRVIGVDGSGDRLVTAVSGQMDTPEWAPSGSLVAYSHNVGWAGSSIEVVDVDASTPTGRVVVTTGGDRTFHVHWSRSGRSLSYLVPGGLYVVPVDAGGPGPRRIAEGGDPTYAGGAPWSPDDRDVLVCRPVVGGFSSGLGGPPLEMVRVDTGASRVVGSETCLTPAWSPDGRFTAVVDLSRGNTTHLVVRGYDGEFAADLGEAWGIGVAWTTAPSPT